MRSEPAHRVRRSLAATLVALVSFATVLIATIEPAAAAAFTAYAGASDGTVEALGMYPGIITIAPADTVTWNFTGFHSVTFGPAASTAPTGDGSYDGTAGDIESSGGQFGGTFTLAFPNAGNYSYVCLFHPGMQGIVQVLSSGVPPGQAALDNQAALEEQVDLTAGEGARTGFIPSTTPGANATTVFNLAAGVAPTQATTVEIGNPGVTNAEGKATLTVSGNTLHVELSGTGMGAGTHAAHIHHGQCAANIPPAGGTILFPLTSLSGDSDTKSTDITLASPAVIPQHGWYINIHDTNGTTVICGDVKPHRASTLRFLASPVQVAVGDTVTWTNRDPQETHTVTFGTVPGNPFAPAAGGSTHSGSGDFHSGPFTFGGTYSLKFTKPGTYSYVCAIHSAVGMVGTVVVAPVSGYWLGAADGGVFTFGKTSFFGSKGSQKLSAPIAGIAAARDQHGYWLAGKDGKVYPFGSAGSFGGVTGSLNAPVVGIAATPDGSGYWLTGADGGVFAFGSAKFFGSTGALKLNKPVVGIAAAPDGLGYWLTAADGGVFTFGSAKFFGSTGNLTLNQPVIGIAGTPDGNGYWLAAADGGVFTFGTAKFFGSTGSLKLNQPVVAVAATSDGNGYWLAAADGGVFNFGTAAFLGSMGGASLLQPVVGIAPAA